MRSGFHRLCRQPTADTILRLIYLEDRSVPTNLVVTTASDAVSHTGLSLRDAVAQANTDSAAGTADTITFDTTAIGGTTVGLTQGVLSLTAGTGLTTINGAGVITVNAGGTSGVFQVSGKAAFSGLLMKGGTGIGTYYSAGGAIFNGGSLTINNCVVSANKANIGGGICNFGAMTIANSAVTGNTVTYSIGEFNYGSGEVGTGGGIWNNGTLSLINCNVSFNTGDVDPHGYGGGGIFNFTAGRLGISNTTFYRNISGGFGGGIDNAGTLALANATIASNNVFGNNTANSTLYGGGGIRNTGSLFMHNTLVANNTVTALTGTTPGVGPDISGYVGGGNNNAVRDGTGLTGIANAVNGNKIGTSAAPINAQLSTVGLANNGGPTQTIALLTGSPAIGAGGSVATLANGITSTTTTIVVAQDALPIAGSSSGNCIIRIDSEQMLVTGFVNNNELIVTRGFGGTAAATHNGNTGVYLATDQRGATRGTQDIGAYAFNSAPGLGTPPLDPTRNAGERVTLTASAFGRPRPTTQWQVSVDGGQTFTNISGANSNVLSFIARPQQNHNFYRALFANKYGKIATDGVELFVNSKPMISQQPRNATIFVNADVTFVAQALSNPVASVQWQVSHDGGKTFRDLSGANSTVLTFVAQAADRNNWYRAVFANAIGETVSKAAKLTVTQSGSILASLTLS